MFRAIFNRKYENTPGIHRKLQKAARKGQKNHKRELLQIIQQKHLHHSRKNE